MATEYKSSFEGGVLQSNMTATQAGPGETSFTAIASGPTYSNSRVAQDGGAQSFRSEVATATQTVRWSPGTGDIRCALLRAFIHLDTPNGTSAAPGTELAMLQMSHASGAAGNVQMSSGGKMRYNAAGTYGPLGIDYPVGQFIRWVYWVDAGTTAGNDSSMRAAIYAGNSTNPLWDSGLLTGLNLAGASGQLTDFRLGKYTFPAYGAAWWMDGAALRFGGTEVDYDPWPALTSNVAPTGSVGADKTAIIGQETTVTAAAADTDGTIVSYLWEIQSGPSVTDPPITNRTSATARFTPTALGTYIVRCTWTDNGGASGYDELQVIVVLPTTSTSGAGGIEYAWSGSAWR